MSGALVRKATRTHPAVERPSAGTTPTPWWATVCSTWPIGAWNGLPNPEKLASRGCDGATSRGFDAQPVVGAMLVECIVVPPTHPLKGVRLRRWCAVEERENT
jgi:hypothetical protein